MCSPKGSGFLYARPDRQNLLDPLIISWGWRSDNPGASPFQDCFEWTGTHDPAAYLSVPAAIQFQAEHDWPAIRAACHELVDEAQRRIGELTGLPPISPDGPGWWGQMRRFRCQRMTAPQRRRSRRGCRMSIRLRFQCTTTATSVSRASRSRRTTRPAMWIALSKRSPPFSEMPRLRTRRLARKQPSAHQWQADRTVLQRCLRLSHRNVQAARCVLSDRAL
jgi:hypothetical protein